MSTTILNVLSILAAAALPWEPGDALELRYQGELKQIHRGSETQVKDFSVYLVLHGQEDETLQLDWLVEERGGSGWNWPERMGQMTINSKLQPAGERIPRIMHVHDGVDHPLDVEFPIFAGTNRIADKATWQEGNWEWTVGGTKQIGDRTCREVNGVSANGRSRTVCIDTSIPIVVSANRRLFMGRGDQFELSLRLESVSSLSEAQLSRIAAPLATFAALQAKLGREPVATDKDLSDKQLQAIADEAEKFRRQATDTPLAQFANVVLRDVKAQQQRVSELTAVAESMLGRKAPAVDFQWLTEAPEQLPLSPGRITVLHFWDYQDSPLKEPYGQVGYLDFLNNRRRKLGVDVVGVAVHERFGNPQTEPAARRSARKLKEFMNLGYSLGVDDGSLLKLFGDPRRSGGQLPLWVVVGADGKIIHYRVGYYAVDPRDGLKELDDVLVAEIQRARKEAGAKK